MLHDESDRALEAPGPDGGGRNNLDELVSAVIPACPPVRRGRRCGKTLTSERRRLDRKLHAMVGRSA